MPPAKSPQQHPSWYSSIMARLLKLKVLLDLVISDLLRTILALLLFTIIAALTFAALEYHQWSPDVAAYLQSTSTSTPADPITPAASSSPTGP